MKKLELIRLQSSNIKKFVSECLEKYSSQEKIDEAEKVIHALCGLLKHEKVMKEDNISIIEEALVSAAYLHNIFFDSKEYNKNKGSWIKIFEARDKLYEIGKNNKVADEILDAIFGTIEGQLGQNSPIKNLKTTLGTPTDNFATAIWIAKEYVPNLK